MMSPNPSNRNYKLILPGEDASTDPMHDLIVKVFGKMRERGLIAGSTANSGDKYTVVLVVLHASNVIMGQHHKPSGRILNSATNMNKGVSTYTQDIHRSWVDKAWEQGFHEDEQSYPLYVAYLSNPDSSVTSAPGKLKGLIRNHAFNEFLRTYMEMKLAGDL